MTSAAIEQKMKANSEAAPKSAHTVEQITKDGIDHLVKSHHAAEQIGEPATDALAKPSQHAHQVINGQRKALVESGTLAMDGFQELVKAYQSLATKNAQRLSASMKALAGAKTMPEFFEIQHRLAAGRVEEAVNDYLHIAELTAAIFTASFEPLKRQVATLHRTVAQ